MKPKKNLWPYGISLAFILFGLGTAGLIAMACSQKVELVSPNYYEQELKFQGQIDRLTRSGNLGPEASVTYDRRKKTITISLPSGQTGQALTGHVQLYRPSAAGLDQELPLQLNQDGVQAVDATNMRPGLWKVRVSWTADGQEYFLDRKIVVGS
jgi:nitrogen fixation protein FixH